MQGRHLDWNTLIYNYGRTEVVNFLVSNGLFWFERYGVDGLRVDAVASMLYLDYSRPSGGWIPNKYGGRENLDAIAFLHRFNRDVFGDFPNATTVAEESTAWPQVSRPIESGGLGFGYKWNMGWMHDTLNYISQDPIYRKHHHGSILFGLHYAFSENFILPLSHDEVVHGKRSILGRMPGDEWQRFANLRAYYSFMFAHSGKKLMFMGCEFGQEQEWSHERSLDWHLLERPNHVGVQSLVRDLNRVYRGVPALHELDCDPAGLEWIITEDADNNVFAWIRKGEKPRSRCLVLLNFSPTVRHHYRVRVPFPGQWVELLNSDSSMYGGSNVGNAGTLFTSDELVPTLTLTLPPLAACFLLRRLRRFHLESSASARLDHPRRHDASLHNAWASSHSSLQYLSRFCSSTSPRSPFERRANRHRPDHGCNHFRSRDDRPVHGSLVRCFAALQISCPMFRMPRPEKKPAGARPPACSERLPARRSIPCFVSKSMGLHGIKWLTEPPVKGPAAAVRHLFEAAAQ
jgi:hypothetical protein